MGRNAILWFALGSTCFMLGALMRSPHLGIQIEALPTEVSSWALMIVGGSLFVLGIRAYVAEKQQDQGHR